MVEALVAAALVLLYLAWRLVRRGLDMQRLVADGVNARGVIVNKVTFNGAGPRHRYLRYRYTDAAGAEHSHRSLVTAGFWDKHVPGGEIEIVYSAGKPSVSAPRELVDQCRAAMAQRKSPPR